MRLIVMSDMHFGVPETTLNDEDVRRTVVETIKGLLPVERIILLGDILDLNLARLGDAIDGRSPRGTDVVGFRQFLKECLAKGIKNLQWIYIPGNHDYDTFDVPARLEGMNRRFVRKTDEKILYWAPRPWEGGNIAPRQLRNDFLIQYPHRWEKIGTRYILLTHGHYLDPSQTMGKKITGLDKPGGIPVDKYFTLCAQYQSLTRAISYQGETIRFFGSLYGAWTSVGSVVEEIIKYGTMSLWRHKALDAQLRNAALSYVRHFGPIGKPQEAAGMPDAVIFGHTHREGMASLGPPRTAPTGSGKGLLLVNDGGFIHGGSDGDIVGSLVEVESAGDSCNVRLHVFERTSTGNVSSRVAEERSI
ncbi:MAG: metallophosphoesterase [bacterium]|jgi:predicted phosphodiesterase